MSPALRRPLSFCCGLAVVAVTAAEVVDESRPTAQFGAGPTEPWPPGEAHLLETLLPGLHARLEESGNHVTFSYYGEVVGNLAGGLRSGAIYEGLAEGEWKLDLERVGAWPGLTAALSFIVPHGDSPTAKLVGDLFTVSNIDAPDTVRLYDLWLEQSFGADAVSLRVGQFASDEEFIISDLGSFFLNGTFGWPAFLGNNVPSPGYPLPTLGARLRWDVTDRVWVQAAIFNGNPAITDANGELEDPHGIRLGLVNGALGIQEFGLRWDTPQRPHGFLKAGGWYHTGEFTRLSDSFAPVPRTQTGTWGLYLVAEQTLWLVDTGAGEPTEEGLHAFLRAAAAPEDVNLVSLYAEGGLRYFGLLPGRPDDSLGLACAFGRMSDDFRRASQLDQATSGGSAPPPDHELVMEATYEFQLTPWWSLQPDVQWVHHPGGSAALPDAWVLTLRTTLIF